MTMPIAAIWTVLLNALSAIISIIYIISGTINLAKKAYFDGFIFLFSQKSIIPARYIIIINFASSDGCILNPANENHLVAPFTSLEKRTATSKINPNT